jgi:hypothetical protein
MAEHAVPSGGDGGFRRRIHPCFQLERQSPDISVYTLSGSIFQRFEVGDLARTDTSMFSASSCLSPLSKRAGIFLYSRKRTLLGQEKTTDEHLSIIDLRGSRTLLSLPVSESDPLLNCSLSQDGRTLILLRGLSLSVFDLAG